MAPLSFFSVGSNTCVMCTQPRKPIAVSTSQFSCHEPSSIPPCRSMAALFTSMWSAGKRSATALPQAVTAPSLARSTSIWLAFPPSASISETARFANSTLLSAIMTWAPSAARRLAVARPMPEAPPVMRATLSVNRTVPQGFVCIRFRSSMK